MSTAPLASRRRIYLMRHASVSYFDEQGQPLDPRAVPLNAAGREQVAACAEWLADVPFDRAICSGLPRTEQTARAVLGARPLALEVEERFKEIRAGRLREVPAELRERAIAYAYDGCEEPGACFIGGESWGAFTDRVSSAWAQLLAASDWQELLLVAHDAVNRVILSQIVGGGLHSLKAFEQDPACLNIIETDRSPDGSPRCLLRAVNLAAYDPIRASQRLTVMEQVWAHYRPRQQE